MTEAEATAIAAELLERKERDQEGRTLDYPSLTPQERAEAMAQMTEVDQANTARMKEIVATYGWPTISMVGKDASNAAFLLVQHADRDPEFQAMCLPMLKEAAAQGEVSLTALAYLTDRVRVKQERPQLYGTQYHARKDDQGNVVLVDRKVIYLVPIVEDVDQLDERRQAMGLGAWFEYEQRMAPMQQRTPVEKPRSWDGVLPVELQRED